MINKILDKLTGSDALIRAARKPDRHAFAQLFGRSLVTFLQLPPGLEQGIDPNISREDLLALIASAARGLSQRTEFTPFCRLRNDRHSMLLFTRMPLVEQFQKTYCSQVQRLLTFEALTVEGKILVSGFDSVDSVVLNAESAYEYELSAEDIALIKQLWS